MHYKLPTFLLFLFSIVPFFSAPAQVLEPQDGEFQVSAQTTLYQYAPSVAMQDSGDFVSVWHADREAASGTEVLARRYASDGSSVGDQITVTDATSGSEARVATTTTGGFIVAWQDDEAPGDPSFDGILARRFGADGQPEGTPFLLNAYTTGNQSEPDIAVDETGAFTVVWTSSSSAADDSSSTSIQLRRFDSAGSAIGTEIQVNSYTTSR